jgi:hypothetical protein
MACWHRLLSIVKQRMRQYDDWQLPGANVVVHAILRRQHLRHLSPQVLRVFRFVFKSIVFLKALWIARV